MGPDQTYAQQNGCAASLPTECLLLSSVSTGFATSANSLGSPNLQNVHDAASVSMGSMQPISNSYHYKYDCPLWGIVMRLAENQQLPPTSLGRAFQPCLNYRAGNKPTRLPLPQISINAAFGYQFFVGALFGYFAVLHDDQAVQGGNCG